MVEITWYIGFIGNFFLAIFYLIGAFLILFLKPKSSKKISNELLLAILTLFSFSLMIFSVILLYWQIYLSQRDLFSIETPWPILMWVWNLIFFGFLFLTICYHYRIDIKIIWVIFSVYLVVGMFNGLTGISNYIVFWNEGNVLVFYPNKTAEGINSVLNILILVLTFYISFNHFLEDQSKSEQSLYRNRSIWLNIALFISICTFFIPRTIVGSITNPVNVKLISYIFLYSFLGAFLIAWTTPIEASTRVKYFLFNIYHINQRLSLKEWFVKMESFYIQLTILAIFSLMGIIAIIITAQLGPSYVKIYEYADNAVTEGLAIYLWEFNNIKWYLHLIGGLLPILIASILLLITFGISSDKLSFFRTITTIFSSQLLLSVLFNNIFKFGNASGDRYSPFILGFLIPPILMICYNIFFSKKQFSDNTSNLLHFLRILYRIWIPLEIACCTVYSSLVIDFLHLNSPTGKILIGGGSWIDGIILVPLFTSFMSLLILVIIILIGITLQKGYKTP